MARVTGLTAARMQQIINAQMSTADVVGDDLVITRMDETTINAGNVRGPKGDTGDVSGYPGIFSPSAGRWRSTSTTSHGFPSGGWDQAEMVFDTAEFTPINGISLVSGSGVGRIQVANAGVYHIDANVAVTASVSGTEEIHARVERSGVGSPMIRGGSNKIMAATTVAQSIVSGDLYCDAGTILSVWYQYSFGHSLMNNQGYNTINVHRVA